MKTFTEFQICNSVVTVPLGFYPANTALRKNSKGNMINVAPGIPFGIAFIGRWWSEETLISLAYAFEQRTMARGQMNPYYQPAFELGDNIFDFIGHGRGTETMDQSRILMLAETMKALLKRATGGKFSIRRLKKRLLVSLERSM